MLPSSVEEGKLWPQAVAGVVRPAPVPTTPRWLPPREGFSSLHPLLIQGGELFLVLMSPCIDRGQFLRRAGATGAGLHLSTGLPAAPPASSGEPTLLPCRVV